MRLEELKGVTLSDAANDYIENIISPGLRYSYKCYFNDFFKRKLLDPEQSLYSFSLSDVNAIGDNITKNASGIRATRYGKASFYRGFTGYLEKISLGRIRKSKVFHKNRY